MQKQISNLAIILIMDASFTIRLLKIVSSGQNAQEDFAHTDMERWKYNKMTPMIQLKTVDGRQ